MVAIGAQAEWLTRDHLLQYGSGAGSPLEKLCQAGGRVLLLGAPLSTVTLLHYAEHAAQVPAKRTVRYQVPMIQQGRKEWVQVEELDSDEGIVDWPDDYFETIVSDYLAAGNGRTGKVGAAQSYLLEAAPLVGFGVQWMEEHFVGSQRHRGR